MVKIDMINEIGHCNYPNATSTPRATRTVLLDLDGTVINSEPIHALALQKLFERLSLPTLSLNYIEEKFKGYNDCDLFEELNLNQKLSITELINLKNRIMVELITTFNPTELKKLLAPKIEEYILSLKNRGIKIGIVSAGEKEIVELILKKCGLYSFFDTVISREDTHTSKPSPSPYLLAMRALKTTATETLIFEDSRTGIKAANQTNAKVIEVDWTS